MTITTVQKQIALSQLDPWGTVADLGSTILEGEVKAFGKMTFGAPTDPVSSAYFGVSKGKFRMEYPFNEQAVVVTGEVILTEEATGKSTRYGVGDTWFVTKGTVIIWEIVSDEFVKHYFAVA
ncbi:cupin domain-containing protein [Pseudomonas kitaguniensis]|uniref:cupin domain-containing protein n=1 Tax=Pseudomonas kitaguniensis TaxID=2607908 RepID=UPI003D092C6E